MIGSRAQSASPDDSRTLRRIAQRFGFTGLFGDRPTYCLYLRGRRKACEVEEQARRCRVHESSGLARLLTNAVHVHASLVRVFQPPRKGALCATYRCLRLNARSRPKQAATTSRQPHRSRASLAMARRPGFLVVRRTGHRHWGQLSNSARPCIGRRTPGGWEAGKLHHFALPSSWARQRANRRLSWTETIPSWTGATP